MASWAQKGTPRRVYGGWEGGPVKEVEEEKPGLWKVPELMKSWWTWKGKGKGEGEHVSKYEGRLLVLFQVQSSFRLLV
jgi:hypothetical protein